MFQDKLLIWYHGIKRPLPWRKNHKPYFIWLSEIMLQQTQVATVIDYFNRFIIKFPTVYLLAKANEEEVLKLWEGLGYYSRARRLIPCAIMIVDEFGGEFPSDYQDLLKLPGVGSYTAGAISSIAFNKKVAAVDGNVMRVYSRFFNMSDDISINKTKKIFEEKVQDTLPEDCRHYNQALMELGALVCTPKNPKCEICPISMSCEALKKNIVLDLPVKTKKIKKKTIRMAVCNVIDKDLWMMEKRLSQGLLGGMWGFPSYPYDTDFERAILEGLKEDFDLEVESIQLVNHGKHVFTHLIWEMTFYQIKVKKRIDTALPENKWLLKEDISKYPIPTAYKKLLT